jgi:hypothetical protein
LQSGGWRVTTRAHCVGLNCNGLLLMTWCRVALGVRSDRTDRSRSSVILKVRSSKNGDRSVSFKTQDRASSVSISSVRSRS